MASRSITTARQERLGTELRRMRERAGLTLRQAAKGLGMDPTRISHAEAGRVGIAPERLRSMAAHYDCVDQRFIDGLVAMTGERTRGWWEEYRDRLGQSALDLAELEHHAHSLHTHQAAYVPGLLQTEDYMRGVLSYAVPEPAPETLEAAISFRLRRRDVLDRGPGFSLLAVTHEAALRTRVTDRKVAREQLLFLLAQSERPNVTVRVIPFDTDHFGGAGHSILHVRGSVARLDTVVIDAMPGAVWLDAEAQLAKYRASMDKVTRSALSPSASRDLVQRLAHEL
ncbi:transcriptional regulator WhiJ [Streptomyces mayteni]